MEKLRSQPQNQPDILQFNQNVFGINSSPFGTQFVSREHAKKQTNTSDGVKQSLVINVHGQHNGFTDDKTGIKLYHELSNFGNQLECMRGSSCVIQ